MKKEVSDLLKKELQYIGLLFLLALAIFKVVFFKEDFIVLLRSVLSLFWLFVLPSYFILLYWRENLEFIERFVIGIAVSAGIIGMSSYYLGLIGLNIKYHIFLLPLALILIGMSIIKKDIKF